MAESKQTPRQKMIGMMYLVLTALLALNISKDVLEAFLLVNNSIEKTVTSFGSKNEQLYADFDLAYSVDPIKTEPHWKNAQEAKKLSEEMQIYLDSLKTLLVMETEDIERNVADTINLKNVSKKDDVDNPTRVLIGKKEDASEGKAHELKIKIRKYREQMLVLLPEDKQEGFDLGLETEDVRSEEKTLNWEIHNFYHNPLVASVTILSKLQNDIKNVEYDVVSALYSKVTKSDFPIDTIAAKVLAQSNYVLLGDEYQADIFVAAFSKTRNPDVYLGKLNEEGKELISITDSLEAQNGMGKMSVQATSEGFKTYEGMVRMLTSDNQYRYYPFKAEYIVARPSLVVSPTQMNVFYKGVENPVDVSVPGIASENLEVNISDGNKMKKVGSGKYVVELKNNTAPEVDVIVKARLADGSTRSMGSMTFRTKNLPTPYTSILSMTKSRLVSKSTLEQMDWVNAEYDPDFPFRLKANVISYKVIIFQNGGDVREEPVPGYSITQTVKRMIKQMKKGERILFDDIQAEGTDGKRHTLNPLVFTVQ